MMITYIRILWHNPDFKAELQEKGKCTNHNMIRCVLNIYLHMIRIKTITSKYLHT